jgi:pimeloyl-ACP methyl ester carboxylesterase
MDVDCGIDVRELLRKVQVPTLVLHCDRDKVVSPEHGRQLAAEIPNARYASIPSANHLLLAEEPAWEILVQEFSAFLGWYKASATQTAEAAS